MREAHAHIAAYGESLSMPRLDECASLHECLDHVRSLAANTPKQGTPWLRLAGARVEKWPERRWPSLAELDQAAGGVPCVIMSFDYHAAAANTEAMRAAGLRAGDRVGANGEVCVEAGNSGASGLLLEDAAYAAWKTAPEPSAAERRRFVVESLTRLRSLGFTEVHDLHSQEWLGPLLGELDRHGQLPIAVRLYPAVRVLAEVHRTRGAWETDRVRLAGGKVFTDGTLNSRTALMLSPYAEPLDAGSACGRAMLSRGELDDAVRLSESLGLHLAAHAIGDGAVRMVLDSIESVGGRESRSGGNRHRIEHCELIDAVDVPRFARLGVVCSVQPCHLLTDIDVLVRQLPERLDRVLPLRELIEAGCTPAGPDGAGLLWFGSDAPIVRPEPQDSIFAAVERRRPDMPREKAMAWDQRLSEAEAWACFGGNGLESGSPSTRRAQP